MNSIQFNDDSEMSMTIDLRDCVCVDDDWSRCILNSYEVTS
jgi:hypothetical protein